MNMPPNPTVAGRCAIRPRSAGHLYVDAVEKPLFDDFRAQLCHPKRSRFDFKFRL